MFLLRPKVVGNRLSSFLNNKNRGKLVFFLVVFCIAGAIIMQQLLLLSWGERELRTDHYLIVSSASEEQTKKLGLIVEDLFQAHVKLLGQGSKGMPVPKLLRLNFYGSRTEFRVLNWPVGWAEGLYRYPISHAYYEPSPNWYFWMLHEATHQLNREVAQIRLPLWAEEGLAAYFSTSTLSSNELQLGVLDYHTYPLWWGESFGFTGSLDIDKKSNRIIGLRDLARISSPGEMGSRFNLVYFEWLSLVHFLLHYDSGRYQSILGCMINRPEAELLPNFQKTDYWDTLEVAWYAYMVDIARYNTKFKALSLSSLTCPNLLID